MLFGHRGANQPVQHGERVLITSQNHGFALDRDSLDLPGLEHSQTNISDDTSEELLIGNSMLSVCNTIQKAHLGPMMPLDIFNGSLNSWKLLIKVSKHQRQKQQWPSQ